MGQMGAVRNDATALLSSGGFYKSQLLKRWYVQDAEVSL